VTRLNILVIATQRTPAASRIAMALADAGFRVAALTPHGNVVRLTRKIKDHFAYHSLPYLRSMVRAIDRWSPDLLVCTDDLAVGELQALHQRTAESDNKRRRCISKLIELSLGPASSFPAIRNKSDFSAWIKTEGIRAPRTIILPAGRVVASVPTELSDPSVVSYPIVVKADRSSAGYCVRVAKDAAEARAALWELQTPSTWRIPLRQLFGRLLGSEVFRRFKVPLRRTISLQDYIPGRPANRAVVCWKGKVLAGISVEVVEAKFSSGPASVVRLIDHSEMASAAEHIVKCLDLSGFVGFDFILDSSDHAWVIEMNPRVTPTCHFSLADGTNLAGSLYAQMTGLQSPSRLAPSDRDVIALFPNEVARSASSKYLMSYQHDVPWNEPDLVRSCLRQALGRGNLRRVRRLFKFR
jgi:glutathione synthase/RimK-type ligase-like ATP-grasp enzyme